MKAFFVIGGMVCVIGAAIGIYYAIEDSGGSSARIIQLDPSYVQRTKDGYWKMGNTTNPKAVLLVYNDFQCQSCVKEYQILQQATPQLTATTEIEFRNYPMSQADPNALLAAEGAEAAGAQGKFWDMYLLLYANNSNWTNDSNSQLSALLDTYAGILHVNVNQFNQDMSSSFVQDEVNADETAGNSFSITSAPAYVLNGTLMAQLPDTSDELIADINQAIANK